MRKECGLQTLPTISTRRRSTRETTSTKRRLYEVIMKTKVTDGKAVAKRAFYLAWQACGTTFGMGFMQDKKDATEEDVWNNVQAYGDYAFNPHGSKQDEAHGDYVFGRRMKLVLQYGDNWVAPKRTQPPDPAYQMWADKYPTYDKLIQAAIESVEAGHED